MASVDGSKSWLGASDEVYDIVCGPCKIDRIDKEAKHYCQQCEEHLCNACQDAHRKLKATKNHHILSGSQMPKPSSVPQRPRCNVYCKCNQNREVEVYCEGHNDVICNACATVKHRRCKTFSIQEKSASYSTTMHSSIISKTNTLRETIQRLQQERSLNRNKLKSAKDACRKEITTFRKELMAFLDNLERHSIQDLEKYENEQKSRIDEQIKSLTTTLQMIDIDYKLLEEAKHDSKAKTMFASEIKVSKNLTEYEALLVDMQKVAVNPELCFEKNSKLVDIKKEINSLGSLKENTSVLYKHTSNKVILGMNIQSSNEHNVNLGDDKRAPRITECTFMTSGHLVFCDYENGKLKLLDKEFEAKDSLKLNDHPYDLSVIDDKNVIVTLPGKMQLQHVQAFPHMKAGRVIQLDKTCYGVTVAGDDIYISCHNNPGQGEIRILDLSGNMKRKFGVNNDGLFQFQVPYYLTLSKTGNKMFVSDWKTSTITCMTTDGDIIYQYKDDNLRLPTGLFVDAEDNIIVCSYGTHNVQVITADGKKYGTLVSSSDGIQRPYSVTFRGTDNTLVVGCYNLNNLFCFQLSQ